MSIIKSTIAGSRRRERWGDAMIRDESATRAEDRAQRETDLQRWADDGPAAADPASASGGRPAVGHAGAPGVPPHVRVVPARPPVRLPRRLISPPLNPPPPA